MNDFGNLGRYRDANAKLGLANSQRGPCRLHGRLHHRHLEARQVFPGKPYVNRGIGGQTTPQMLIRFRPDVIDLDTQGRRHSRRHQ